MARHRPKRSGSWLRPLPERHTPRADADLWFPALVGPGGLREACCRHCRSRLIFDQHPHTNVFTVGLLCSPRREVRCPFAGVAFVMLGPEV